MEDMERVTFPKVIVTAAMPQGIEDARASVLAALALSYLFAAPVSRFARAHVVIHALGPAAYVNTYFGVGPRRKELPFFFGVVSPWLGPAAGVDIKPGFEEETASFLANFGVVVGVVAGLDL